MNTETITALSSEELKNLLVKQNEELAQKDQQIKHLTNNANKWVQRFDDHQNSIADDVVKKFELEFEQERSELRTKITLLSEENNALKSKISDLQNVQSMEHSIDLWDEEQLAPTPTEPEKIQTEMFKEPSSVTEIEFSPEMKELLAKYAS